MKKFINCFKKYFVFFGIWLVVSIFLVSWEFSLLTKVPETRKIDILVNSTTLDETRFENIINENKPDYLKEVNYRNNSATNGMLYQVIQTYGSVETDIYILSNDVLDEMKDSYFNNYFFKLDETICNEIISNNLTYYCKDKLGTYGILLESDYLVEEGKSFYILFANDSLHLGKLNNQELDGAVTICKALLNK